MILDNNLLENLTNIANKYNKEIAESLNKIEFNEIQEMSGLSILCLLHNMIYAMMLKSTFNFENSKHSFDDYIVITTSGIYLCLENLEDESTH